MLTVLFYFLLYYLQYFLLPVFYFLRSFLIILITFFKGDFDWEEHTRMAEELEGSLFPSNEDQTKDSGFITMDRGYSTATQEVCNCRFIHLH